MEKLYLFNTLSRKKEEFKPIKKGQVGIYGCGPTVYWYAHIGAMRRYIFEDILVRTLAYNDYKVNHVINVTDVGHLTSDADEGEDKMEKAAAKEGKTAEKIAQHYYGVFIKDLKKLNITFPDIWAWATKHVKEQIELIQKLEKKGYTYKTSDGIYFDSLKFKNYGRFANLNIEGQKAGKRVVMGEKKNKSDFALWKFSENTDKRQQEWDSPWGVGFPGWHIECSAMSMKYLGETFDIHTGGEEHIPIHHTNEIAQAEAATGKKFVNFWLHNRWLMFHGEKMSKSSGEIYTLSELEEKGYEPMNFRYLCLMTNYRKPLDFTLENLDAAKNAYDKLKRKVIELKKESHKGEDLTKREYDSQFLKAINDDLNTPKAIQVVHRLLEDFDYSPKKKLELLEKFDEVLGLGIADMKEERVEISKDVQKLVDEREKARKNKNFEEADVLRNRIREAGFNVSDTSKGPKLEKI